MIKRNMMYNLSSKTMKIIAAMALVITAIAVNQCCMWYLGQDKMPAGVEKLRRF